jgi:hypothetical protein
MDLAGSPDRRRVAAGDGVAGLLAPALDQPLDRHILVGEKMAERDFDGAGAGGQFAQAQALARDDRIEKLAPLLSRRRSRKRPSNDLGSGVRGSGVVSWMVSMNMKRPR